MPSETFFRLPEEKRTRFLNASWEEFTRVRFADVSINQIIKKAGIPRGSFYQYFTDKDELCAYLLEEVRRHISELYHSALIKTGGDIFRAQLACFDGLISAGSLLGQDPLLSRCVQFLRNNQGIDIQKFVPAQPRQYLMDSLWELLDLRQFRRQDREYVYNVCALLIAALGSAFMDALCHAEDLRTCRKELILRMEIIKSGCLVS